MINKVVGFVLSVCTAYVLGLAAIETQGATGWYIFCTALLILFSLVTASFAVEELRVRRVNKIKVKENYERVYLTDFQKSLED